MRNPDYEGVSWYKQAEDSKSAASEVNYIFQNYYPAFLVSRLFILTVPFPHPDLRHRPANSK